MDLKKGIRKTHRWVSTLFVATVVANFAVMAFGAPPMWLVYAPLPPLLFLMLTGIYLFILPFATRRRSGEITG